MNREVVVGGSMSWSQNYQTVIFVALLGNVGKSTLNEEHIPILRMVQESSIVFLAGPTRQIILSWEALH